MNTKAMKTLLNAAIAPALTRQMKCSPMQTYIEMQTEIEKLSPSQRSAMRRICGTSKLDAIKVEQIGWKTKVDCRTRGFRYVVKLGPKGKTLEKSITAAH